MIEPIEIKPIRGWVALNLWEIWAYRDLLYFLIWRDVKVRYKQTVLGVAWAIIQPLATMLVFSIFFGNLAQIPSDGVPYPVFTLTGLVVWTFFSNALRQSSESLIINQILITRVYFPRLIIPIAAVFSGLVDFALAFLMLIGILGIYGIVPSVQLLFLPIFLGLLLITALGVGSWLAALNVQFRDVRYAVPFLTQLWLFITPIAYPSSLLNPSARILYGLNPMVGVVEGLRWALLGTNAPSLPMLLTSACILLVLFVTGLAYFRRMENHFADVI